MAFINKHFSTGHSLVWCIVNGLLRRRSKVRCGCIPKPMHAYTHDCSFVQEYIPPTEWAMERQAFAAWLLEFARADKGMWQFSVIRDEAMGGHMGAIHTPSTSIVRNGTLQECIDAAEVMYGKPQYGYDCRDRKMGRKVCEFSSDTGGFDLVMIKRKD